MFRWPSLGSTLSFGNTGRIAMDAGNRDVPRIANPEAARKSSMSKKFCDVSWDAHQRFQNGVFFTENLCSTKDRQ
jgi:hypothetical protein